MYILLIRVYRSTHTNSAVNKRNVGIAKNFISLPRRGHMTIGTRYRRLSMQRLLESLFPFHEFATLDFRNLAPKHII